MDVELGLRVVRGPDWEWGDQDGGEGHVGTVVEVGETSVSDGGGGRAVVVQWDCGERSRYRCGVAGKYDLRVLDSAPAGLKHVHTRCHGCNDEQIAGILWQCVKCFEYFLCTPCYMVGRHSLEHVFLRVDTLDINRRVNVPARARSASIEVKGIFPGAKVVRGHNWRWQNQDGGKGNVGVVVNVTGWQNESERSVVEVKWSGSSKKKNIYRLGHRGKVDLKLVQHGAATIGHYFPSHLPLLGAPYEAPSQTTFAAGDRIKVDLNPDVWKRLQEGHGGWNDIMASFIDTVGAIVHIADDGDLVVNYHSNAMFHINSAAATKVNTTMFRIGDVVRVMEDRGEVTKLQKGHGEWNESMATSLGQVARVVKVLPNGDVRISVGGRRLIFNPACLKHAPGETATESSEEDSVNVLLRAHLRSMLQRLDPDTLATAAAAGDSTVVREYLSKKPDQVDSKVQGKTALHVAAGEGFTHVIKIVLKYGPDLNAQDNEGDTPLHICAHMNQDTSAELLVKAGADVNYKNAVGLFPLAVAAAIGNHSTLRVLVKSQGINLNEQDLEGNTALHISVLAHRNECVSILLDAGADPTIYNSTHFSPVLEASKNGFYAGIEQFIGRFPEHVNMIKMDDGHSVLHIAAANDHLDIVSLLSSMETCNIDIQNFTNNFTPLHLAGQRGYARVIEALIGYGADVNATASDGQTVLHLIMSLKDMQAPTEDTPELQKMMEQLKSSVGGEPVPPYIAMACLLVREGANPHLPSLLGMDAMTLCPPEMVPLVHQMSTESHSGKRFKGSFARYPPDAFKAGSILRIQEIVKRRDLQSGAASPQPPVIGLSPGPTIKPATTLPLAGHQAAALPPAGHQAVALPPAGHQGTTPRERGHTPLSTTTTSGATVPHPLPTGATNLPYPPQPSPRETQSQPPPQPPKGDAPSLNRPMESMSTPQPSLTSEGLQGPPRQLSGENVDQRNAIKDESQAETATATDSVCILCDNVANCLFSPCGHAVMCIECGKRTKKCPECKVAVNAISVIEV